MPHDTRHDRDRLRHRARTVVYLTVLFTLIIALVWGIATSGDPA